MARGVKAGRARETVALTEEAVAALVPTATRRRVWVEGIPSLCVVVHQSGSRVFCLVRKHGGAAEYLKLGAWPVTKCDAARRLALAKLGEHGKGESPAQAKRATAAAARARVRLNEAWEAYKAHRLAGADERRQHGVKLEEWTWKLHLAPTFGDRPVDEITRAEVARWHAAASVKRELPTAKEAKKAKKGPRTVGGAVAANRAKALLSGIFSHWIVVTGSTLVNPAHGVKMNRETARTRYLTPGELRRWWAAVLAAPADDGEALALLLLTATRSGTLRCMDWAEIDWLGKVWNVPAEKLKARRAWVVPLNAAALGTLRARWERQGCPEAGPVFTGTGKAARTDLRGPWERAVAAAGVAGATVHDARRTAATAACDAGVDSAVVAHLLQHVGASVLDVYRRVTPATAAAASERMAAALLRPAGLEPRDFAAGLPRPEAMRPEGEADAAAVLLFPGAAP